MRPALVLAVRAAPWLFSLATLLWVLATNPFAAIAVDQSTAEVRRSLDRAMAHAVTSGRLEARLAEAVAAQEALRVDTLLGVAERRDVPLPQALVASAEALTGRNGGWSGDVARCATCAADIGTCRSLSAVALCALPVEMSPVGDANAIRRQAGLYWAGDPLDEVELGLAVVGLGATAVAILTGGTSVAVKVGATATRIARRLGTLSAGMRATLHEATDIPVRWGAVGDYLLGRVGLEAVTDLPKLERLGALASDTGRIAGNAGMSETLLLLRHADGPEDLGRLARLSDAAGAETLGMVETLGRSRVFRALVRLSDEALAAAFLLWAAAAQILVALASLAGSRLARSVLRRLATSAPA